MKKLSKDGINEIKKFSKLANYNEYNSNVVTMFMWDHKYEVFYETHEHFVLILVNYHHRFGWLMPLCEEKYLNDAFKAMGDYSKKHHIAYEIHGMNQQLKHYCETNNIHFIYHNDVDAQDYVYDIEMQKTLNGKKMQKRRNHFNAFIKEYEHRFMYTNLTKDKESEIFEFLNKWKNEHIDPASIENEMIGIKRLFDLFDELNLHGGCLYIDGQLKAFSIYSELSQNTIQMHVEKADHKIRGLYVAILKYTLMHCDKKYKYLNREDDLGLASLRKAKSDLHPIYKIKKYIAFQGDTHIQKATCKHTDQIKKLWIESFKDEDEQSSAFFFDYLYHPEDAYLLMHESKVICMLQTRKMKIHKDGIDQDTFFIIGVATNPYYQSCGYMKQLMNYVLSQISSPFVCIQAYDWDLYKPFGFSETYMTYLSDFEKQGNSNGFICDDASFLLNLYQQFTQHKDGYRVRDLAYYQNYLIPYKKLDSEIIANEHAYIIVNKEHTFVSECIYTDKTALIQLLNRFSHIKVMADIPFDHDEIRNSMMVLGHFNRNDSLFINEFL